MTLSRRGSRQRRWGRDSRWEGENVVVDGGSGVEDNENTEAVWGENFDDACVCAVLWVESRYLNGSNKSVEVRWDWWFKWWGRGQLGDRPQQQWMEWYQEHRWSFSSSLTSDSSIRLLQMVLELCGACLLCSLGVVGPGEVGGPCCKMHSYPKLHLHPHWLSRNWNLTFCSVTCLSVSGQWHVGPFLINPWHSY